VTDGHAVLCHSLTPQKVAIIQVIGLDMLTACFPCSCVATVTNVCNVMKTISIAQYRVQTAARALNIVNKQYMLSQTE